jgi:glycine cleavage system regulatory protein
MSRLGGQFAGILRVELPAEREPALAAALKALDARGLTVVVSTDQSQAQAAPARLRLLEIVGHDRPGIVRQISHALARNSVNVEELHTECCSAAMTGEILFKARAKLEKIAADLIVAISFEELVDSVKR